MLFKKRKGMLILLLASLQILLGGCNSESSKVSNGNSLEAKEIIFQTYGLNNNIIITDKTDINNIEKLFKSLNVKKEDDKLEGEINGYLKYNDESQIYFSLSPTTLILGNNKYDVGAAYQSIASIFNKYISNTGSDKMPIEVKEVKLSAYDIEKTIVLDSEGLKLFSKSFAESDMKFTDDIDGPLIPEHPYYSYDVYKNTGEKQRVDIINDHLIIISSESGMTKYYTNDMLKSFAAKLLPASISKDKTNINYLFNAKKLVIKSDINNGDYSNRIPAMVRLLKESKLEEKNINGTSIMSLTFYTESENIKVLVYKDGFKYLNSYYYLENAEERFRSFSSAG